jgi:hypothetical protein
MIIFENSSTFKNIQVLKYLDLQKCLNKIGKRTEKKTEKIIRKDIIWLIGTLSASQRTVEDYDCWT